MVEVLVQTSEKVRGGAHCLQLCAARLRYIAELSGELSPQHRLLTEQELEVKFTMAEAI